MKCVIYTADEPLLAMDAGDVFKAARQYVEENHPEFLNPDVLELRVCLTNSEAGELELVVRPAPAGAEVTG